MLLRLLLVLLLAAPSPGVQATDVSPVERAVAALEQDWAHVYYETPLARQRAVFPALLERGARLIAEYPGRAEPLVMHAVLLCTNAGLTWNFHALSDIQKARDLLLAAISIDPSALEGSAYITLGALHYQVPGWPISFGDDEIARTYLEAALRLYPDAVDSNHFYGDFLERQGEIARAREHLLKARAAPVRASTRISDLKLKQDTEILLARIEKSLHTRGTPTD